MVGNRFANTFGWLLVFGIALGPSAACQPCVSVSGHTQQLSVFRTTENSADFDACAQTGNCLALCKSSVGAGETDVSIEECRRVDGATTDPDVLTLSIRIHLERCGS